jgi:hypothetical protein
MDKTKDGAAPVDAAQASPTAASDYTEEARIFYARLEEAGQLKDVGFDTDTSQLPPTVTHVRYPDGAVQRIGFS